VLHSSPQPSKLLTNGFFIFAIMVFFFTLGDATMSFIAPVIMEHKLGAAQMGIILSTSSMAGTIMDFTFAKLFGNKKPRFFVKIMLAFSVFFPISFILYQSVPSFIFGMLVWGVYFEAMVFSNYHTIHQIIQPKNFVWAWGMLATVRNIAWVFGPIAASYLFDVNESYPLFFALIMFTTAIFLFLFINGKQPKVVTAPVKKEHGHGFVQEFKIWIACGKVIWPILFLMAIYQAIDSAFFSIGPVFAEDLQGLSHWGSCI
jgi:cyanate permease